MAAITEFYVCWTLQEENLKGKESFQHTVCLRHEAVKGRKHIFIKVVDACVYLNYTGWLNYI